jgi:hypothetical protein
MIDTGDHVLHKPTGETWIVARVDGDRLAWCGWPEGWARLSDCRLVKKARTRYRDSVLMELAGSDHHCAAWALDRIAKEE